MPEIRSFQRLYKFLRPPRCRVQHRSFLFSFFFLSFFPSVISLKLYPLLKFSSPFFLFFASQFLIIGRGGEGHPALSRHGAGQGGVGRFRCSRPRARLQSIAPAPLSFLRRGGRVCGGMGCVGWVVKSGEEREREKQFKIFFFPASACAGEEGEQCCSK